MLASAELLRRADLLICNDSAPAHIAAAVGTPVIAIFGPTVPRFGFSPYGDRHTVIEENLTCRPCGNHGGKRCREGHFLCMKEIMPARIVSAAKKYLI